MITPLPGITTTKPGSATVPFPGIDAQLLDGQGKPVPVGGGYLAITSPWPGMLRTIWGDDELSRRLLEQMAEHLLRRRWSEAGRAGSAQGGGSRRTALTATIVIAVMTAADPTHQRQTAWSTNTSTYVR